MRAEAAPPCYCGAGSVGSAVRDRIAQVDCPDLVETRSDQIAPDTAGGRDRVVGPCTARTTEGRSSGVRNILPGAGASRFFPGLWRSHPAHFARPTSLALSRACPALCRRLNRDS